MSPSHREILIHNKAHRILRATLNNLLQSHRLSLPEWTLLGLLFDNGPLRISELARELEVEVPHVTVLVKSLQEKGFVSTKIDPSDSRAKLILLSSKAKKQMPALDQEAEKGIRQHLTTLSEGEVDGYFKVLHTIVNPHPHSS